MPGGIEAVGSAIDMPLMFPGGRASTALLLLRLRPKEKDAAEARDDIEPLLLTGLTASGTWTFSAG